MRTVCRTCDVYCPDDDERRLFQAWAFGYVAWSLIGGLVVALNGPGGVLTLVMLQAMCLGGLLASATHEAGHALAAAALGGDVPEVRLGRGPAIGGFRWGDTVVRVGRYAFLGGQTQIIWPGTGSGWRVAAAMLAGPASNLLGAALMFWLGHVVGGAGAAERVAQAAFAGLGLVQFGAGALNLLPAPAELGQPASDGAQAWAALTGRRRG